MISHIAAPLQLDSDCHQISCHFDTGRFHVQTAAQLGLTLPPSLNGAVQKRKAEFIAGRYCARAALAQLDGCACTANRGLTTGIGANREPLWPHGIVGSITHTHGYASAMVAYRNKVRALGVDSEAWIEPKSADNVSEYILTPRERKSEQMLLLDSQLHYLTLVFSAKESLFKCLFPLVNRFFDFHSAIITPRPSRRADGEFRFELLKDLNAEFRAGYSGHGNYSMGTTCVHTAVIIKAHNQAA